MEQEPLSDLSKITGVSTTLVLIVSNTICGSQG